MSREIKSRDDRQTPRSLTPEPPNDYKDRLVKLIPSEIVTAYITLSGLLSGLADGKGNKAMLLWIIIGVLFILTPVYLKGIGKVNKPLQLVFSSVAFLIWVLVIGSPLKEILHFPASFIGSILLVLYTLVIPFVYKG